MAPQAGWYQDPSSPGQLRYWDGAAWTEQIVARSTAQPPSSAPSAPSQSQYAPPPNVPTPYSTSQYVTPPPSFGNTAGFGNADALGNNYSSQGYMNPVSGMGMGRAISTCMNKFAVGKGRASRSEYWWFYLFALLIYVVINILQVAVINSSVGIAVVLVLLLGAAVALGIPSLAASVRRLHDTDKSAHYLWFLLIPFAGVIVFIVFMCMPSTPGPNRYGPQV